MSTTTPMMKQYMEIKERAGDCILFFRLGDFYEMFGDDARIAARELEIVLTSRDKSSEDKMPMCGFPYHSAEPYIARLISRGYKVAICEQLSDPRTTKGIVDRDIVRIITPGTLMESSMLDDSKSNYLCTVYFEHRDGSCVHGTVNTGTVPAFTIGPVFAAACFADLSTGEIAVTEFRKNDITPIENEISSYLPREAILGGCAELSDHMSRYLSMRLDCFTQIDSSRFGEDSISLLKDHFGEENCDGLSHAALCAAGALISYIMITQKTDISHLRTLSRNIGDSCMELDISTMRNLELVGTIRTGEKKGSLLWVIDKTKTPMGRRLIRSWVLRPLLQATQIKKRLNAVSELVSETLTRGEIIHALRGIGDMERIIGKIVYGNALSRDLKALATSILALPKLSVELKNFKSAALKGIGGLDLLTDIAEQIDMTIIDDPPFSVREAGFVKSGFNAEVDRLRNLLDNSKTAIMSIEIREKERTGKKNLKVKYNKVFGHYIEIPRSSSDDVPDDYVRKQTLVNCERFITQELKELEEEEFTAKDKLTSLEYSIFEELRGRIAQEVARVQSTAGDVAELDVFCSLAEVAAANNYSQPEIDVSGTIEILDGRHPVVEIMQKDMLFVPNDTHLDNKSARTAIITGPNMAGKSTYMRQTALIVLMAQIGSFVPAKSARIGIVDRVFTRIGASDDLSAGKSTFMVEMTEVADILKNATKASLLILDEIGRGTSTYDGMSVARAVLEHCNDKRKLGAKTMFATHYHELTVLEDEIEGIKNYNITAKKRGDDIIFLRKIVSGGADDSYGIEVAAFAGVPDNVIRRAKAVLKTLEDKEAQIHEDGASRVGMVQNRADGSGDDLEPDDEIGQLSLTDLTASEIAAQLKETDINTLTPLEALNMLYEMKNKLS